MILTRVIRKREIPEPGNLIAHYLPGVGQTANGTVSTWEDQSATGADMTQDVVARLPTIANVNGFDAFSFVNESGSINDDFMNSNILSLISGNPGATVFAVIQFDAAQTDDGGIFGVHSAGPTYTTGANLVIANDSGPMKAQFQYRRTVTDSTIAVRSTVTLEDDNLYQIIGRVNFANGSQLFDVSVNGTKTVGTTPTGAVYAFDSFNRRAIAGALIRNLTGSPTLACTGRVIEAGVYDRSLSDASLQDLQMYFFRKYNV